MTSNILHKIEFHKVRTCDSFTICTLVHLLLSVISTSELVLIASSFNFYWQHISRVHFVCSIVSASARCILLSAQRLRGGKMEVRNQSLKTSRFRTCATGSPGKNVFIRWHFFFLKTAITACKGEFFTSHIRLCARLDH